MNLERLRLFLQIVDSGSMSAAARAVHLTQPALSRTLKLLEEDMGVALFTRRGRALVLTPGGRALVPRGRALLADSDRVAREVGRSAERAYFDLRLGHRRQRRDHAAAACRPWPAPRLPRSRDQAVDRPHGIAARPRAQRRPGRWSSSPTRARRPASTRASWDRTGCSSSGAATSTRACATRRTEADLRAFPIVEIDPGHGEPQLIPEDAKLLRRRQQRRDGQGAGAGGLRRR